MSVSEKFYNLINYSKNKTLEGVNYYNSSFLKKKVNAVSYAAYNSVKNSINKDKVFFLGAIAKGVSLISAMFAKRDFFFAAKGVSLLADYTNLSKPYMMNNEYHKDINNWHKSTLSAGLVAGGNLLMFSKPSLLRAVIGETISLVGSAKLSEQAIKSEELKLGRKII